MKNKQLKRSSSLVRETAIATTQSLDVRNLARELHDYYLSPAGMAERAIERAAESARDRIAFKLSGVMDARRADRLADLEDLAEMEGRIDAALVQALTPAQESLTDRILAEAEKLRVAGKQRRSWAGIIAGRTGCSPRYVRGVLKKAEL